MNQSQWENRFKDLIERLQFKIEWFTTTQNKSEKKNAQQLLKIIKDYSKVPFPVPIIEGGYHSRGVSDDADILARKLDGVLQSCGYAWPTFQLAEIIRVVKKLA